MAIRKEIGWSQEAYLLYEILKQLERLDGILASGGGGGSGTTNLGYTAAAANGVVTSSTGTSATITLVDATNAGLMSPADFTKLTGLSVSILTTIVPLTSYTLLTTDNGKQIITTSATPVTITVPTGLQVGFNCQVLQQGAGQVSFVGSGTTLRYSSFELPSIVERYGVVAIDNISNVPTEFVLYGKLTSI